MPPLLLTFGADPTARPATSQEDGERARGEGRKGCCYPTPHLCACVFCPFRRSLYPDPFSTCCTQNSLEEGLTLSSTSSILDGEGDPDPDMAGRGGGLEKGVRWVCMAHVDESHHNAGHPGGHCVWPPPSLWHPRPLGVPFQSETAGGVKGVEWEGSRGQGEKSIGRGARVSVGT